MFIAYAILFKCIVFCMLLNKLNVCSECSHLVPVIMRISVEYGFTVFELDQGWNSIHLNLKNCTSLWYPNDHHRLKGYFNRRDVTHSHFMHWKPKKIFYFSLDHPSSLVCAVRISKLYANFRHKIRDQTLNL